MMRQIALAAVAICSVACSGAAAGQPAQRVDEVSAIVAPWQFSDLDSRQAPNGIALLPPSVPIPSMAAMSQNRRSCEDYMRSAFQIKFNELNGPRRIERALTVLDDALAAYPVCEGAREMAATFLAEHQAASGATEPLIVSLQRWGNVGVVTYETYFIPLFQPGPVNVPRRQELNQRPVMVAVSFPTCNDLGQGGLRNNGLAQNRVEDLEHGARSYVRPGNFVGVATAVYGPSSSALNETVAQCHRWMNTYNPIGVTLPRPQFVLLGVLYCESGDCRREPSFVIMAANFAYGSSSAWPATIDYINNVREFTNLARSLGLN